MLKTLWLSALIGQKTESVQETSSKEWCIELGKLCCKRIQLSQAPRLPPPATDGFQRHDNNYPSSSVWVLGPDQNENF